MKILELLSSPVWTGPAEPMASVALELARRGHAIEAAVDKLRPGDLRERLASLGLALRSDLVLSVKSGPVAVVRDLARLRKLGREFDVLHAHFSHDHTLAVLAAGKWRSARVVRTIHSARALGPWRGWVHRRSDGLIAVCERHAAELRRRFGIAPERVAAIRGAVDASFFTPEGPDLRSELAIDPAVPVAGIVSRVKPGRGHAQLLRAFAEVKRTLPEARLLVVGRGEGVPEVRAEAAALGLEREVFFAGYRAGPELAAAYRTFDVKVLMAEGNDGSCRALLEAMACARPGISFDFGAPGETIEDGVSGRLVPLERREDPGAWAPLLAEMLADRERARAMGRAARERMVSLYTEEARGDAVERFLQGIVSMPAV